LQDVNLNSGDITDLTSIISAVHEIQPDWIFHLASQSYVPQSFKDPLGTFMTNCLGTQNVLEAIRLRDSDSRIIFAGSSEEYGLQFDSEKHLENMKKKYGVIEPLPREIPEIPIDEQAVMRPMSPYATSKVYGDFAFRNYHMTYGLDTVVSRAFNHEGAGRGHNFVTSAIIRQVVSMHLEEQPVMNIGDVQTFRDWSHVLDVADGYVLLAEKADPGSAYVQGSMHSNSVLSYILFAISALGYEIQQISNIEGEKKVKNPLEKTKLKIGTALVESNVVDQMLLSDAVSYNLDDKGLIIETDKRKFKVQFDPNKYRPSDVPILISNNTKIKNLGFVAKKNLFDIINDQINYYLDPTHRNNIVAD
jgi:GDPmannose 4,6-dehydratase